MSAEPALERELLALLTRIHVSARRLLLDTGTVRATAPQLRGVWGKALRQLDKATYDRVFEGRRATGRKARSRTPRYVIRPAPLEPETAPAVEWIVFHSDGGPDADPVLLRAWQLAADSGLGPDRTPFRIRKIQWLAPDGSVAAGSGPWRLAAAAEILGPQPGLRPVRLEFPTPLRILRRRSLIRTPSLTDIAAALTRRLLVLRDAPLRNTTVLPAVLQAARRIPSGEWEGQGGEFVRWSGTQKKEVVQRAVIGGLDLPTGPGDLWPLLAAGPWIHIGKSTTLGLGQLNRSGLVPAHGHRVRRVGTRVATL